MSKLMKRNIVAHKEEANLPKPVEAIVPIRALAPNLLIGQGGVIRHQTPFNAMGIYVADAADTIEEKGGWSPLYNLMLGIAYDKLQFLLTDAWMSALNTCINSGLIDYNKVDIKDFSYIPVNTDIRNVENIGVIAATVCSRLFSVLYKYAILGRRSSPEEAREIVDYLNMVVANVSNIAIHHLTGYYNEVMALRSMSDHDISKIEKIGAYDNAYATENLFGELFLEKEDLERNNAIIEQDVNLTRKHDDSGVSYNFNPAIKERRTAKYCDFEGCEFEGE